jgi:glycogen debranching enzyme
MSIEIRIADPHLTIHHGHGVLVTEPDGCVRQPSQKGLFFRDTRLISGWRLTIEDAPWIALNSANEDYDRARLVFTNPKLTTPQGEMKEHTLGLTLTRAIGDGLHDDLDIVNHGMTEARFMLGFEIVSDFGDFFEVKGNNFVLRSGIASTWSDDAQSLENLYRNGAFLRGIVVRIRGARAAFANGKTAWPIALKPRERWQACLFYDLIDGDERFAAPAECPRGAARTGRAQHEHARAATQLHSSDLDLDRLARQSAADMAALRLYVPGTSGAPIVAAGVPWFLSLFGRDSIIASLQYRMIDAQFACGVLDRLGDLQADFCDDYRDAEPGKIPHELRHGELAFFGKIPHTPYYGTADATPLYLILLHSAWKCTGDARLIERHLATAERCLDWIDRYGDRDSDGFQEYQTRSLAGYENQSWKDAGDAILYPDGSCVKGPKATCELQGYVFDAWLRMAEIFDALGQGARANALRRKAKALYHRFNDAFWDERAGFYALALDGDKKRVMTIASNPGHCLWSGIVPRDRAARVVERLMQPDLWSGWGIRTLSSRHPAFNPFSYQNGSVWPHDNSLIALGLKRYGFAAQAGKLARGICAAASFFMSNRLPELFAGIDRGEVSFPLRYLGANVPQAWATGTVFALVEALIGFQPEAPDGRLVLDPDLPEWLHEIEIRDIRLAGRPLDLRLWRDGEVTKFEVTKGDARAVERRVMRIPADDEAFARAA